MNKTKGFYSHLHKQILVMIGLSLGPGLAYILLGIIHQATIRSVIWYGALLAVSGWGYQLYKKYDFNTMSHQVIEKWYRNTTYFYYAIFILWTIIFILYAPLTQNNLHYIAIFTQIGTSVVASTLLFSDRRLFIPIILTSSIPLTIFFAMIGTWYGYVLTIFTMVFMGVLYYAASSSNRLLQTTSFQASHDQLTGLYNRTYFVDAIQQLINTLKVNDGYCCLILIDLDHFKTINDSLGHDVGDILLKQVAARMQKSVPHDAIIARMGGDEFIVVGSVTNDQKTCADQSKLLAEKLRTTLKETYNVDRHQLYISASLGMSIIHKPSDNAGLYIKEADIAMYEVKDKGRDGIVLFGQEISQRVEKNLDIERLLHLAILNNELSLNFQPQFNKSHEIAGCEVLLRWTNPEIGMVSPADFIPIAEKTGIIIDIGNYVMQEAFKTLKQWDDDGILLKHISINVSMRQFFHSDFLTDVQHFSDLYLTEDLRKKVIFELTESVMADGLERLIEIMTHLKNQGFLFSIDDFGTGYSSLGFLRKVPVDEIKIDRSFIEELTTNSSDQSMIEMILNLSKVFGLTVVAEGIETPEQEEILLKGNCDLLQGFLLSKPLSKDNFEQLYKAKSH